MAVILGIDPGKRGGLAVIAGPPFRILACIDVPLDDDGVDVLKVIAFIQANPPDHSFMERVSAMPSIPDEAGVRRGMGATSAFNFGGAVFAMKACVTGLMGKKPTLIQPVSWKKYYGLSSKDPATGRKLEQREVKEASRQVALKMFREGERFFPNIGHHNRGEACLIARFGAALISK